MFSSQFFLSYSGSSFLSDAVIQFINLANYNKPLGAQIPGFSISLEHCVPLLFSCLSADVFTSVSTLVARIEARQGNEKAAAAMKGSDSLTPDAETASEAATIKSQGISLPKGERFEDEKEIAAAEQLEAELCLATSRLDLTTKCCNLLDSLTDNSCLEIHDELAALDASPPILSPSLVSSLASLQQQQQPCGDEPPLMAMGWSIVTSTLAGALQSILQLKSQLSTFTTSE